MEQVLGVDPEAAELFVRTAKREVLALDLESGRLDTVATDVQRATLGPDGTVYAVDAKHRVTTLSRRVRLTWPHPLTGDPTDLFGASNERLVATVGGDQPVLLVAAADQPQASPTAALPTETWLPADGEIWSRSRATRASSCSIRWADANPDSFRSPITPARCCSRRPGTASTWAAGAAWASRSSIATP